MAVIKDKEYYEKDYKLVVDTGYVMYFNTINNDILINI